jgi:predicted transcriptional regulator
MHRKAIVMDLATRKHNLIQELTTIDESLLEKLEQFLKANRKDWLSELSAEEQDEIEVGLKQAKNNEFVSHETVMNKFSKWH